MAVVLGYASIYCGVCGHGIQTDANHPRAARRAAEALGWDVAEKDGHIARRLGARDLCSTCRAPDPNSPTLPEMEK